MQKSAKSLLKVTKNREQNKGKRGFSFPSGANVMLITNNGG